MSRARGPLTVGVTMLGILLASVLFAPSGPAVASLPPPPDEPLTVSDRMLAAAHAEAGISVASGWRPGTILGPGDPWEDLHPTDGVLDWVDDLPRLRAAYDTSGRLIVEDAVVLRDPARCYHLARIVRQVSVGLPPPVGPAIAEQIEAWLSPPYFSAVRPAPGTGPCVGRDRSHWGFAIELAEPLDCDVPGRDVLCVTVAKWRYDFGPRDRWTSAHLVFDVVDGTLVDDGDLHPDLDLTALDALVDAVVCAAGGRCDGVPPREGRIHPTTAALVVDLSPGEGAHARHGSLRVTIPRDALPRIDGE